MKKQGIKYKDSGCCPGHDKFPREAYSTRSSLKAKRRTDRLANKRARQWAKRERIQQGDQFLIVNDPDLPLTEEQLTKISEAKVTRFTLTEQK